MVDPIEARHAQFIWKSLSKQLCLYTSRYFVVSSILSDHEGGLVALKPNLERLGIKINIAGPDQHVPAIENRIKTVKERVRCTLHSLPLQLPLSPLQVVVMFFVSRINLFPSTLRSDKISPSEAFSGLKTNFKRDVKLGFGDYCEVFHLNHPPTLWTSVPSARYLSALLATIKVPGTSTP